MKYRIAIWAGAGFLVASFWALYAFATSPFTNQRMQDIWPLVHLTCPITFVSHHPLGLPWVLAANAATYALVGLIVEALRQKQPLPPHKQT